MNISESASPYIEKKQKWSSHWFVFQWLAELEPGTKLLDIGTATGILGQACSKSGFFLTGLEQEHNWAKKARPYYQKFWEGTIETAPSEILADQDVVILADILEHLSKPDVVLKKIIDLQPAGCIFIISVPNIANISIRVKLLFGRFDYQQRGILDQTHLHHFTRQTLLSMLKSSGLEILVSKVTPMPLALVNPFFENSVIGQLLYYLVYQLTKIFPTLLGYQFIIKAQKRL